MFSSFYEKDGMLVIKSYSFHLLRWMTDSAQGTQSCQTQEPTAPALHPWTAALRNMHKAEEQ